MEEGAGQEGKKKAGRKLGWTVCVDDFNNLKGDHGTQRMLSSELQPKEGKETSWEKKNGRYRAPLLGAICLFGP